MNETVNIDSEALGDLMVKARNWEKLDRSYVFHIMQSPENIDRVYASVKEEIGDITDVEGFLHITVQMIHSLLMIWRSQGVAWTDVKNTTLSMMKDLYNHEAYFARNLIDAGIPPAQEETNE
jgi:hypothetical protein